MAAMSSPTRDLYAGDTVDGPVRRRLAGWCLAIAATGTPSTVAVLIWCHGGAAAAGATVIGTITVAAFTATRAFMRADSTMTESQE
jgi:hypothetical protein